MGSRAWLIFVAVAGLAWGTYVPLIAYGGNELGGFDPKLGMAPRLMAVLCVGIAYFLIAVLFPAFYLMRTPAKDHPDRTITGLTFSGLAGAAGAIGAICVIFATSASAQAARGAGLAPGAYKLYIAPLIFGLAPVINTLVSIVWHPKKGQPFHFAFAPPHPLLWLGILSVGFGAFLVLFAKELMESKGTFDLGAILASLQTVLVSSWFLYVALAGLSWGVYVPLIFYGGSELGGKPSSRLLAILCVGVAYFLLAVLLPGALLLQAPAGQHPVLTSTGLSFAGLAGAAGAIGAIGVIFATKSAIDAAKESGLPPATYKLFIAPLIFGLAPIINTLVSMVWHPEGLDKRGPFVFEVEPPHWILWVGIFCVGLGAALVLYSKELGEAKAPRTAPPSTPPAPIGEARPGDAVATSPH
jgi:hypothetical protein